MSADEVRGPRHAAPKKPLFTRFHVPSGKAIALAAMPTAVLMGMGFTPTLALADGNDGTPTANSLTVDEYQACLEVVEGAEKDDSSASPTPSASASESASPDEEPSAETPEQQAPEADQDTGKDTSSSSSSSDSGSDDKDDKDESAPAPSAPAAEDTDEPEPEPSETDRNILEGLGDAIKDVLTPKDKEAEASPTPSASAAEEKAEDKAEAAAGTVEETTEKVTEAAGDIAKDTTDKASEATGEAEEAVEEVAEEATETPGATASPSPSASATVDPEDCPVATDAEGGVDNEILLPDDPWTLNASSLLLKGADYQGIVEVRTASGATKKVLKYVISDGTDIGDLHQTVKDERSGATHHVQAAKGSTSTIRDGDTVMYTESISGNLLGLIPVTFDPENPPPLNIPLIYFTKVTVKQAGQFGGTLHVPGLRQYITG
ncbi:hypothetical protein ACH4VX_04910 [Streptomyces sp. NPDC020731]|uniref:hypothetical protein n=1 Tax=Streptomyces sp. NPDC020731 TaxID=3365085 RepID=UPI003797F44B